MKYIITIIAACFLNMTGSAQIELTKSQIEYNDSPLSALLLRINLPEDDAKDLFKEYMDTRYNYEVMGLGFLRNKDKLYLDQLNMINFNDNQIDMMVHFLDEIDGETSIKFAIRDDAQQPIKTDILEDEYSNLQNFIREYYTYAVDSYYSEKMSDFSKDLSKLEKKLNKTDADILKANEEINENKIETAELQDELKQLELEKSRMQMERNKVKSQLESTESELTNR